LSIRHAGCFVLVPSHKIGALVHVSVSLIGTLALVPSVHRVHLLSMAHLVTAVAAMRVELVNVAASHQNFSLG
jgi:hypothetical protein